MPAHLIITLLAGVFTLSAAHAHQLTWSCEAVYDRTGEAQHQDISIDTDRHTVVKNGSLKWHDGKQTPVFGGGHLQEFVQLDPGQVAWGDRLIAKSGTDSTFLLDFQTGRLTWTDPIGRVLHGSCRPVVATS